MPAPVNSITMNEAAARRVLLAQAIESADPQGRLVDADRRAQIDRHSGAAARLAGEAGGSAALSGFLQARAALVLEAATGRDRALVSLQDRGASERWITAGLPLAALLLGVFTDQVANPHQVNLLSKPLLLLLLWNLVVYGLLLAHLARHRSDATAPNRFAGLRQWLAGWRDWGRRPRHLRSEVGAAFLLRWHRLTGTLYGQRLARTMHLAAAAWALGVALSLFFGGVWARYGVQWESTFLSAPDVHRFLSILFRPVTALFPWASFSLEEVRALRATGPLHAPLDAADNFTGRRWVFLHAMLLTLFIVLPRVLLAAVAWWHERTLARAIPVDLADPYFQRLLSLLTPAQVQLCLLAHRNEDRAALLRVLLHGAGATPSDVPLAPGQQRLLLEGPGNETLGLLELPDLPDLNAPASLPRERIAAPGGWTQRLRFRLFGPPPAPVPPADPALLSARDTSDVVLHVVGSAADLGPAAGMLGWLGKPVLVLVNGGAVEVAGVLAQCKAQATEAGSLSRVLGFGQFARCWVQEPVLLDAVGRCLPQSKLPGYARLVASWHERNLDQLRAAMAIVARTLLDAARQIEDAGKPRSLIGLVSAAGRGDQERRTRDAMAAVVDRLQRADADATTGLLLLHGLDPDAAVRLNHPLDEKFVVQHAVSARDAGVAGAATGAAVGVSIDLLTAGLTLGLAAAAGAVVGGGAAWVAAVWKNQATPAGTSVVQLSDAMLQAMVEAALLRYLAVIHFGRDRADGTDVQARWRDEVVAAVGRRSDDLNEEWSAARAGPQGLEPAAGLASMLESITLAVLERLYPATPPG